MTDVDSFCQNCSGFAVVEARPEQIRGLGGSVESALIVPDSLGVKRSAEQHLCKALFVAPFLLFVRR